VFGPRGLGYLWVGLVSYGLMSFIDARYRRIVS
jgi:hypothetical protein